MDLRLIDGHAHLDELQDYHDQIREAMEHGVKHIVGVGMDLKSNTKILKIAGEYPNTVIKALGYHPWRITQEGIQENLSFLRANIKEAAFMGEIGLDYRIKTPKEIQIDVFRRLLEIAGEFNRPCIIHARYSQKRCLDILKEMDIKKGVFHWYSGPLDLLDDIFSCGYYISVTPALAYSPPHIEAAKYAPLDRILIETDCPVEYQGVPSRIKDVVTTINLLSKIRDIDTITLANITTNNFFEYLGMEG